MEITEEMKLAVASEILDYREGEGSAEDVAIRVFLAMASLEERGRAEGDTANHRTSLVGRRESLCVDLRSILIHMS
jgi:hypothetical protein